MSEKKNLQIVKKNGSEIFASLPKLPPPTVVSVTQVKHKPVVEDKNKQLYLEYSAINKQLKEANKVLESTTILFKERVERFEQEIEQSKNMIVDLRHRINQMYNVTATSREETPQKGNSNVPTAAGLTIDTVVDYLKNSPLILRTFCDISFRTFYETVSSQTKDVEIEFFRYSLIQLQRLAQVMNSVQKIVDFSETAQFQEILEIESKKIFNTNSVYTFLLDFKTNEYRCTFQSKYLQLSLKDENNLISEVLESQKVVFLTDPTTSKNYSKSFDPLFNPENVPILLIPIKQNAVIEILHSDPNTFTFSNEDVMIANIFASFLNHLVDIHLRYEELSMEIERRRILQEFGTDLCKKDHFNDMLPFLSNSLKQYLDMIAIKLFIKEEDILSSYDIVNDKLLQTKHEIIGIPAWVMQNKFHIKTNNLSISEMHAFNDKIDGWAADKPFAAFPVVISDQTVIAVLCVSKKTILSEWDLEFLTIISTTLAIVIPRCIENSKNVSVEEAKQTLIRFPNDIHQLSFQTLELKNSLEMIMKTMGTEIKAEWISLYTRKANNTIKRLAVLKDNIVQESDIVLDSYVNHVFGAGKPINETDANYVQTFALTHAVDIRSILCVTNTDHDEKLAIIALNTQSTSGHFDDGYIDYIQAFSNLAVFGMRIHKLNQNIIEGQLAAETMKQAFDLANQAIDAEQPFRKLLSLTGKIIGLPGFLIIQHQNITQDYELLIGSKGVKIHRIPEKDPFTIYIEQHKNLTLYDNFAHGEFPTTELRNLIEQCNNLISVMIEPKTFLLFFGEHVDSKYEHNLGYFLPIIRSFFKFFILTFQHVPASRAEINKIQYVETKLLDSDVSSRLFSVTQITEPQKIEAVLKMFGHLGLLDFLETNVEDFTRFLLQAKDLYHKDVAFHNWDHAIDVTQFVYSAMMRGKMKRFFRPNHVAAILLACLLHDVDHRGFNTAFHTKTNSSLTTMFGTESTLEHHHIAVAVRFLTNTLITRNKQVFKNGVFWNFFTSCIISTDMVRHFEFMDKFEVFAGNFNSNNEKHLILFSQLLIKCGNVGNCTRPFFVVQEMAERLVKEYTVQGLKEKEMNVPVSGIGETQSDKSDNIGDVEITFYSIIVLPLLKIMGSIVPELSDFAIQMEDNKKQWDQYRIRKMAMS